MKILLVNTSNEIRGGADKVFLTSVELLRESGFQVEVFHLSKEKNQTSLPSDPQIKGLSIVKKFFKVFRYLYSIEVYVKFRVFCRIYKPDIIHFHLIYGGGLTNSIIHSLRRIQAVKVMTIHDYKLTCPVMTHINGDSVVCEYCLDHGPTGVLKNKCNQSSLGNIGVFPRMLYYFDALMRDYLFDPTEAIDRFIFVSEFAKKHHLKKYPELKKKSFVVYNYSETERIENTGAKQYDFVYFGRLTQEKGISALLDVFKLNSEMSIMFVGDGPKFKEVMTASKAHSNIELEGFKDARGLRNLLVKCKWSILNSQWYENNPMSIIESLGLGIPVLASDIGGIPELIIDGYNGKLFKPFNSIDLINTINSVKFVDEEEYSLYSMNARRFFDENLNKRAHISNMLAVYHGNT